MAYRYQPRSYLQNPSFFGIRIDADWKTYDGQDLAARQLIAAAFYQHVAACETLRQAGQRGWGMGELAEALGVNKHTLSRKLYGRAPADITDIVGWALAVEAVTVLPAPADLGRMLPPT